jgi:hypothetical protein
MPHATGTTYANHGVRLRLAPDYRATELPEWRAALFSVAFPFPAAGLPPSLAKDRFIDLGGGWLRGRFKGLQRITVSHSRDGAHRVPSWERTPSFYDYSPQSFLATASARFRGPLGESTGAPAVDGAADPGLPTDPATTVRCHRLPLTADGYDGLDHHGEPASPASGQPAEPTVRYEIDEGLTGPTAALMSRSARPSLQVACLEYLQYRGTFAHDVDGTPGEFAQDYLVVHLIAENCSGASLEKISAALRRPRTTLDLRTWDPEGDDDREFTATGILSALVDFAVTRLNDALPSTLPDGFRATVTRGGILTASRHTPLPAAHGADPVTGEPVPLWRGRGPMRPVRTVCAVPGRGDVTSPSLFDELTDSSWRPEDAWAWQLSAGADRYTQGIPDHRSTGPAPERFRYQDWSFATSDEGVALVRNGPADSRDACFWMLSATRFLDLALLVHRSSAMLDNLGERLRAIRFRTLSREQEDLTAALESFETIQSDFVHFRDRLWFNTVPGREIDTLLMLELRRSMGVTGRFTDTRDELELRENVYTTQYNARQLRIERERESLARAEREDGERQAKVQNLLLGILAVAFAVPGVVQVSGMPGNGWTVVVTVILMVVAGLVLLPLLRNLGKPRRG